VLVASLDGGPPDQAHEVGVGHEELEGGVEHVVDLVPPLEGPDTASSTRRAKSVTARENTSR
jgi:hypothetical protein